MHDDYLPSHLLSGMLCLLRKYISVYFHCFQKYSLYIHIFVYVSIYSFQKSSQLYMYIYTHICSVTIHTLTLKWQLQKIKGLLYPHGSICIYNKCRVSIAISGVQWDK